MTMAFCDGMEEWKESRAPLCDLWGSRLCNLRLIFLFRTRDNRVGEDFQRKKVVWSVNVLL